MMQLHERRAISKDAQYYSFEPPILRGREREPCHTHLVDWTRLAFPKRPADQVPRRGVGFVTMFRSVQIGVCFCENRRWTR